MASIVLIDDDPDMCQLFDQVLTLIGHRVDCAQNGLDGVDVVKRERPDLVLLDLNIPLLDGFGVLQQLHEDASTSNIPVLVLSAHTKDINRDEAYEKGAKGFINKPVDIGFFLDLIQQTLQPKT